MANTTVFETRMSARMQAAFYNKPVFRAIVNNEERSRLKVGQSVTRPYRSLLRGQDYTRGSDLSFQDTTDTNETMTITTIKSTPFTVDDFDEVQSNFNLQRQYSNDAVEAMSSIVDGDVLSEVANAGIVVDNADFGGTSGDGITLDTSNVYDIFTTANRKLWENNVDITGLDPRLDPNKQKQAAGVGGSAGYGAFSPYFFSKLTEAEQGRETAKGDRVGINGFVKERSGFDLMISNNLYWTAQLNLATQPTNTDTLVIGGVTVTFVTTIGTTAGNCLIGADVDATRVNLLGLINAPGTTDSEGVAFSNTRSSQYLRSDREKIEDLTATNDATANTLTLTGDGVSYYVLSETLTDGTDGWSKEIQHNVMGKKGNIDMVMQVGIGVEVSDIENQFGKKVKPKTLYGLKTFVEGTLRMIDVKINTASLT